MNLGKLRTRSVKLGKGRIRSEKLRMPSSKRQTTCVSGRHALMTTASKRQLFFDQNLSFLF